MADSPSTSPSFSFTTPEQRRHGFSDDADAGSIEDWHFRNGPSPITAPRFRGEEQDESKQQDEHWTFAHSHFRRRNRLETRLEELQKDVASLTLKLRANGNRSVASLDASSFLVPKDQDEQVNSYKVGVRETPAVVEKRRRSEKEQVSGSGRSSGRNSAVKTLRELHNVTTERDQLKFELERTKRALQVAERKSHDAEKSGKAYEKLKAHCDSLQQSLDLSERIRVRQKKLLQQLQLQQQKVDKKEKESVGKLRTAAHQAPAKRRPASAPEKRGGSSLFRSTATTPRRAQQDNDAQGYTHTDYDILDSLVASSHNDNEEEEEEEEEGDAGLATQEQAPSEPTAATYRSRTPRSVLKPTTPTAATYRSRTPRSVLKPTTPTAKQYRPDFDSLLQVDAPQFTTRRPSRMTMNSSRRPSQTQVQQRKAMRQAARWARSRGAAVDISTSTTQMSARRTPTSRPKNSFLAPTQASLRRLHDLPRRSNHEIAPFVV